MSQFLDRITQREKENNKTIVLPESTDIRVLKAVAMVLEQDYANIVLVGDEDEINVLKGDLNLDGAKIENPLKSDKIDDYVNTLYELRKHKGLTIEQARETMKNPLYWGVMMVKKGEADGMVAGAVNSTANTLRPALQILKTAPDVKMVSAFFIMCVPDCGYGHNGTFLYADSGIVENPNAEELSEFAVCSGKHLRTLWRLNQKLQCFHTQVTAVQK